MISDILNMSFFSLVTFENEFILFSLLCIVSKNNKQIIA